MQIVGAGKGWNFEKVKYVTKLGPASIGKGEPLMFVVYFCLFLCFKLESVEPCKALSVVLCRDDPKGWIDIEQ